MNPNERHAEIAAEADRLLANGLRAALESYGEMNIVGSHALGLMTWRDLDIHLVREKPDVDEFFRLGARITKSLSPHRMHFRDERTVATSGLPRGLYWGVYLGDERAGAWKIDVWASTRADFEPSRAFQAALASRLDDASRRDILAIKAACWSHPEYRRGFTSADVYAAVLDHGVREPREFWNHLMATKGVAADDSGSEAAGR